MQKITTEDSAIIARFQSGNKEAFDELIQLHKNQAYHYALHLTRNPDEAADIVAETFVRLYKSLHNFRGESSFSTWLYRIETNCFHDMRKKSWRREVSIEDTFNMGSDAQEAQMIDDRRSPAEHVEMSERMEVLNAALKQLPKRHRTILMMYHAESMSYEQMAEVLGMPMGTVKSRLNRARLRLRNILMPAQSLFTQANFNSRSQVRV